MGDLHLQQPHSPSSEAPFAVTTRESQDRYEFTGLTHRGGRSWLTTIGEPEHFLESIPGMVGMSASRIRYLGGARPVDEWLDTVKTSVHAIRSGALAKVVLARDQIAVSSERIDVRVPLRRLARRFPNASRSPAAVWSVRRPNCWSGGPAPRSTRSCWLAPPTAGPTHGRIIGSVRLSCTRRRTWKNTVWPCSRWPRR